ncbi:MAG: heme ABC exporter ATP-binding protein CcmA [Candidatus Polarisedimenticolaceae bacterium]|nr:heme ABC exporter ATP-binding protein CcmA [Candidatus Polarisedimenticolaceae bacterium]
MNCIEIEDISVSFGDFDALQKVSLQIESGDVLMLAGPNGAGKSTLLHILLGLVLPDSGKIKVDGKETTIDNAYKKNVAYLPEAVNFSDSLSAYSVLKFFARVRGSDHSKIDETLRQVGLAKAKHRKVHTYSCGMRQRLGLGVLIMADSPLLVLDEPTTGLDSEGISLLFEMLQQRRTNKQLTLFATHDFGLLERRASKMCIIQNGQIKAIDTPDNLRSAVNLPTHIRFQATAKLQQFSELIDQLSSTKITLENDQLLVETPRHNLAAVMSAWRDFGTDAPEFRIMEPELIDVYEELLER